MVFDERSKYLAAYESNMGGVSLYDVECGRQIWFRQIGIAELGDIIEMHSLTGPSMVAFTPDASTLLVGCATGWLFEFDVADGAILRRTKLGNFGWQDSVADWERNRIWTQQGGVLVACPLLK